MENKFEKVESFHNIKVDVEKEMRLELLKGIVMNNYCNILFKNVLKEYGIKKLNENKKYFIWDKNGKFVNSYLEKPDLIYYRTDTSYLDSKKHINSKEGFYCARIETLIDCIIQKIIVTKEFTKYFYEVVKNNNTYNFYASPYWRYIRTLVKHKCEICGKEHNYNNIHHLTYDNMFNQEEHLSDLVCLCPEHHSLLHKECGIKKETLISKDDQILWIKKHSKNSKLK